MGEDESIYIQSAQPGSRGGLRASHGELLVARSSHLSNFPTSFDLHLDDFKGCTH